MLSAQFRVVDFAFYRAGMQNYIGRPSAYRQSQQFFTEIAIERERQFCDEGVQSFC